MRDEVTNLLIASFLCDASFPSVDSLPRVAEIPYTHLGHQILLDYQRLAEDVWAVVRAIQVRVSARRVRIAQVLSLASAAPGWWLGSVVARGLAPNFVVWAPVISGILFGAVVYALIRPKPERESARARVVALKKLLLGERLQNREERLSIGATWGDGRASDELHPVIVASDSHPFPGFGKLYAIELFLCPPEAEPPELTAEALFESSFKAAATEARKSGMQNVDIGKVVVIYDRSLRKSSRWLKDDRPRLFLGASELPQIDSIDPQASVRTYGMIQALLPEHLGIITFFLRTFLSGNSATVEVSLCSLGPPLHSWSDVRRRIQEYDFYCQPLLKRLWYEWEDRKPPQTSLGAQLRRFRKAYEAAAEGFQQRKDPMVLAQLAPEDKKEKKELEEELSKLSSVGDAWVGTEITLPDPRDWFSLSMTRDYFGQKECIACIRTLYDRIGKAVLKNLEEHGYSIEDYKSEGRLILNAEEIGQLVVAERISGPAAIQTTGKVKEKRKDKLTHEGKTDGKAHRASDPSG
jgi:hypothetical protein